MNYNRFFRVLAVAVVLALLMLALPATPAAATELIELDIVAGEVGDSVTVDAGGFAASHDPYYKQFDIYFSSDYIEVGNDIDYDDHYYTIVKQYVATDDDGSFSKLFHIPEVLEDGRYEAEVIGGTYYVYVTSQGQEEVLASAEFTVIGVTGLEPEEGPVGTEVEISGLGFDKGDDITVEYDGDATSIVSGDRQVKSSGTFGSSIEVPESVVGTHTIAVSDESGHSGEVHFTVTPQITLTPNPASVGDELTVIGTGFSADTDIFIYFDGDPVDLTGDDDTDDYGSFDTTFILPTDALPGSYYVEVEDDNGYDDSAEIEIGAGLTVEPVTTADEPGYVGMELTLIGNGFTPDAEVEITYESDAIDLGTFEADENGDFEEEVIIPASEAGEHTITVDDGTNTKEVSFFMESVAPDAPSLLTPAAGDEIEDWVFDWGEVSDDSPPVIYELQIASSSEFSEDSVVIYKIEMATTEYTLTEEEELKPDNEDAPYYWRVRAKDAADNASDWSDSRSFLVGSGFEMPTWLIYVLIGIGVVGLFILGLWLGRRSSVEDYYY